MAFRVTLSDRYDQAVLALNPTNYWPFSERSGTTLNDRGSGNDDGTLSGTPVKGTLVGHGGRGLTRAEPGTSKETS